VHICDRVPYGQGVADKQGGSVPKGILGAVGAFAFIAVVAAGSEQIGGTGVVGGLLGVGVLGFVLWLAGGDNPPWKRR
jgi:hypothetical protein